MKNVGQPTESASPWSDRKVSVMRSRAGSATAAACASPVAIMLSATFGFHARKALARLRGDRRLRIVPREARERRARRRVALQLVLAVARLQERVGRLARARVILEHTFEGRERGRKIAPHVMRLAQPVKRIGSELVVPVLRDEIVEGPGGLVVLAVLQERKRRLVLGISAGRGGGGLRGSE